LVSLATPLAACRASGPEPTRLTEKSPAGLEQMRILATPAGGQPHALTVEVAATEEQQQRGLMFRESMAPDSGMIFPYDPPQKVAFWMHNTVPPLDIIYIGVDHKVLNVAANAVPYSDEPIPSAGDVSAVLELNAGRAAAIGIVPGTTIDWPK